MVAKQNKHIYSSQIEGTRPFRLREYVKRVFFLADYAQELRLYGFGRVLEERYSEASKEQAGVVEKHAGKYTHINAVGNIVGIAIRNSMLILLCFLVADGRMFPGDFLVVINSANQLSVFFIDLSEKLPQISLHSMFIENLRLILDCQTKFDEEVVDGQKPDEVGPVDIALELKNLSFAYPFMPIATLTNINIKVLKKQKVAIVGYNGAGKSTILKLLLRLYDPSEGEIYLNSKSYKSYGIGELRRKFAVVFQNARHYALTISENVLGRSVHGWEDEELVWEALELSGLKDKVERMRGKLSAVLTKEFDDSGIVFSGGELQKLAIARAYAQNADIIIMDEPTSSLDPVSENEIFNRMLKLCRDKTVIFISHKMALAACADYIYVIEEGSVVEEGTPSQLMNANGAYAALHRMQAKGYGGFEA
jgi:ATP-binding cassette subfamily B protein